MTSKASNGQGGDDFEVVDSRDVQYVKRGRKAVADPKLIDKLKTLNPGQTLAVRSMKVDMQSAKMANDKARIGSQIRTACKAAGLAQGTYRILWSPDGIPQVVR